MTKSLLTIDVGNTHQTVALHQNSELIEVRRLIDSGDWMHFAEPALLSQVGPILPMPFQHVTRLKELRKDDKLIEMPIHYSQSLGDDRLALAYFAFQKLSEWKVESVVTVDAGTFTTVDLITLEGFQGGYIFPGPTTLERSYHHGSQLPQHVLPKKGGDSPPRSSEEAIAFALELIMTEPLSSVLKKWCPQRIILCGGAKNHYLETLEKYAKVEIVENAIHKALYLIALKSSLLS